MAKSIKIPRSRMSAVDRLIRFDFEVPRGATPTPGGLREIIAQAEQAGETLELLDPEGSISLGRVTVFEQRVHSLENTGLDQWVVRLRAEDEKAQDTLAALPPGPPDPY
ncbi:hypothetical protein F0U60_18595 [Archangium minus]|uniref:Uncharacterized protein n=1 Tax=Archangium minus TaxID=83450 RepID=A0ABY9WRK9_9BACT|nr:hypothetical protein F0U60_18595 [Archangium minus]